MTDIFEVTKEKVVPTWAKFKEAGDSVQGTYVGAMLNQKSPAFPTQLQHIYQLLQEDGTILNVAFGTNKVILHKDMEQVRFGQIIGFKFKGTIQVKNRRSGQMVNVKDYDLRQDPKIVNEEWLKENKDHMPRIITTNNDVSSSAQDNVNKFAEDMKDDVPFSSSDNLTNEDKLVLIEKLAKEKLDVTTPQEVKEKVMTSTGIAFIPINYTKITEALVAM